MPDVQHRSRVGQVVTDKFAQPQAFIQIAHHDQATVGDYSRSLEIHLQRGVERKLKGLVLLFTHRVQASGVYIAPSSPHELWCCPSYGGSGQLQQGNVGL